MSIPGDSKPGEISGQPQVQLQQSTHSVSAIPIKKRRFPLIHPASSASGEKSSSSEDSGLKNKQETSAPTDGKIAVSSSNSDASKIPPFILKKEVIPANIEFGLATADGILASKVLEEKPPVSSTFTGDFMDKVDILPNLNPSEKGVPESLPEDVKQEVINEKIEEACKAQLSTNQMNVELSLGPKNPLVSDSKCQDSEAAGLNTQPVDPLLRLGLPKGKHVPSNNDIGTVDNINSRVSANRSNWDLNTTMDAWEGSVNSDLCAAPVLVGIGGFTKGCSFSSSGSSLTAISNFRLLGKGKNIVDGFKSGSNSATPINQCKKAGVSLGLGLAMPFNESPLTVKSASDSTNCTPHLNLKHVNLSSLDKRRAVKSEPADENSNRDSRMGSCSNSNMGSSKLVSVKGELTNSSSVEIALPASVCSDKVVGRESIKSEIIEGNQEARKPDNPSLTPTISRVMQHQESSASSSALPVPTRPHSSCTATGLPTHLELNRSGSLSSQSQHSFPGKELHGVNDNQSAQDANTVSKHVEDRDMSKFGPVDDCALESGHSDEVAAADDEKIDISTEMLEEDSFGSDCESKEISAIAKTPDTTGKNMCGKEDEDYEDGEVRERLRRMEDKDPVVEGKKKDGLEPVDCISKNLQPSVSLGDRNINASEYKEDVTAEKICDETCSSAIKNCTSISCDPHVENNSQKVSDSVWEASVSEKKSIVGVEEVAKNVCSDGPTNGSSSIDNDRDEEATNKFGRENNLTSSKTEASLDDRDVAKDSNSLGGNKSRIINLSHPHGKTRSIPNRLLSSRSGKQQRYSNLDGEIQPQINRDEIYNGGTNKFVKDRVRHDQFRRNSRPGYMRGKGRVSGRFGSYRGEWDPDNSFAPETYNGRSDYRAVRRRHTSNISDMELECDSYGIPEDTGGALVSNRRKTVSDEFPSISRNSRRLSPGDRDGTRNMPMMRRIPRNMSPDRCAIEDGPDMAGFRHADKFMRHLSDDIVDPDCNRTQVIYDNFDGGQLGGRGNGRGNRNFHALHRKGYPPRVHSKSPVRSRTRSPGPWQSPRRRSPNGPPPELAQHRSPTFYRVGRMRSPDRACFREEIVGRRREPPPYMTRHPNDMRNVDLGRDIAHPRPMNPDRRSSPSRVFPRITRRPVPEATLDTRAMDNVDEYMDVPMHHPNKFHELRDDGNFDERRKFVDRRGPPPPPPHSFHPNYRAEEEDFRFHQNEGGPRPYNRFCGDLDVELDVRGHIGERGFDCRPKHQHPNPMGPGRRIRNSIEEQVWHEDGFNETRVKRRRF